MEYSQPVSLLLRIVGQMRTSIYAPLLLTIQVSPLRYSPPTEMENLFPIFSSLGIGASRQCGERPSDVPFDHSHYHAFCVDYIADDTFIVDFDSTIPNSLARVGLSCDQLGVPELFVNNGTQSPVATM
jgi:hypothetical protein